MKYSKEISRAIEHQQEIYINTREGNYTGIAASDADPSLIKLISKEEIIWIPLNEITHVSTVLTFKPLGRDDVHNRKESN